MVSAVTRMGLVAAGCLLVLVGCGGSGGDSPPPTAPSPSPAIPSPPPSSPSPPPLIGTGGGTITESSGASVIFPAGAVSTDTTFRIAVDSTGAPPVPAALGGTGSIYMVTPHGGAFAEDVEVRIPAPAVTLQPNQLLRIAKAEPGDAEWTILDDTQLVDGKLSAKVRDFSSFMAVVVTYTLPIAQAEPFRASGVLTCAGAPCLRSFGTVNATYTASTNNGQLPANCTRRLEPVVWHLVFGPFERRYDSGVRQCLIPVDGDCPSRHRSKPHRHALHLQHGQHHGRGSAPPAMADSWRSPCAPLRC